MDRLVRRVRPDCMVLLINVLRVVFRPATGKVPELRIENEISERK